MTKRILIDARDDQETRIASLNDNLVEDFEYELIDKKQLRGNVYLARVSRVEPSLQAAFIEYGGNRQGFLAFSEIHPDYYRIPVEDRAKLLKNVTEIHHEDDDTNHLTNDETLDDDVIDNRDLKKIKSKLYKNYKIQEVISKGQILLVQVVKEERGNKGAALSSYLSLAGRYCVLMPNTPKGGGISRKITNINDRKRLKKVLDSLELTDGMALIIRTAGSKRTKVEIKRDFQNLVTLWNDIKNKTVESNAPELIHEEGSIIKRAVRDMYHSDIEEILVQGEMAFKSCKNYMKTLMPSHTKKIHQYNDPNILLFQKYKIDSQLSNIFKPIVNLNSGGYLVINHTEALVAVDVNSGKATKERSVENTALKTNVEAAEEFARQAKLRDLSGLIVIDFIDMEEYKNRNIVEKKLRESLKKDRARIQVGEISSFGLLELSRQRLRLSVSETSSDICNFCGGVGRIQSVEVSSMQILREAEEYVINNQKKEIEIYITSDIATHVLNFKKNILSDIESRHNVKIKFIIDNNLSSSDFKIEQIKEEFDEKTRLNKHSEKNKYKDRSSSSKKEENTIKDNQENSSIINLINEKNVESSKNEKKSRKLTKRKNKVEKKDTQNNTDNSSTKTKVVSKKDIGTDKENSLINTEKKVPKKAGRKKQASAKIDVVNINESKKKSKPKKKGWWKN